MHTIMHSSTARREQPPADLVLVLVCAAGLVRYKIAKLWTPAGTGTEVELEQGKARLGCEDRRSDTAVDFCSGC